MENEDFDAVDVATLNNNNNCDDGIAADG